MSNLIDHQVSLYSGPPPYLHPARLLPHPLTSPSAASLPTPYFTLRVTLPCLCPSVPVQRHEYEYEYEQDPAHLHGSADTSTVSINQPHYRTVPHTSTVLYCTVLVLAPPRYPSSAPALFILVVDSMYRTSSRFNTVVRYYSTTVATIRYRGRGGDARGVTNIH